MREENAGVLFRTMRLKDDLEIFDKSMMQDDKAGE